MAALQHRNGSYRVIFRYHGKQESFTLGSVSKDEAEKKAAQVDYLLLRLKQKLLSLPPLTGIVDFLQHDGKPPESAALANGQLVDAGPLNKATLASLRARYFETHEKSLETTTIDGKEGLSDSWLADQQPVTANRSYPFEVCVTANQRQIAKRTNSPRHRGKRRSYA